MYYKDEMHLTYACSQVPHPQCNILVSNDLALANYLMTYTRFATICSSFHTFMPSSGENVEIHVNLSRPLPLQPIPCPNCPCGMHCSANAGRAFTCDHSHDGRGGGGAVLW